MSQQHFEVKAGYGVLGKRSSGDEVRLTKTSWYGKNPVWDIRNWQDDIAKQGITLTDEMLKNLRTIIDTLDLG